MFSDPCALAKYLEIVTASTLDLERASKVWKLRETSVTDNIIANFLAHGNQPWVEVDASNEAITNADFEVIFRKSHQDFTVLIQAKRTDVTTASAVRIPELFHPKSTGQQNQALIAYAAANQMLPLYAIYLSTKAKSALSAQPPGTIMHGIMMTGAANLRATAFKKTLNGRNSLLASKVLEKAFPFHALFCEVKRNTSLEELAKSIAGKAQVPLSTTNELITPSKSLEDRRVRDFDQRWYHGDLYRYPNTFRMVIDIDRLDPH